MDIFKKFFIQKYSHEHTLMQEQMTGENFVTHSYVTLLVEQVLASALMLQSCGCRVTHYPLHATRCSLSWYVLTTFIVP